MTRPAREQIEEYRERVWRAAYDHDDRNDASALVALLRDACERVERITDRLRDDDLRAALLDPLHGVPAALVDAASNVEAWFATWDAERADRAQEAEDNKAADAADARMTW